MPIEVPNVLQLIGGSPILKSGDVFINFLKAAKTLDGGSGVDSSGSPTGLSQLLGNIVNGSSLSSFMQNPIAAISALLQTSLTQSVSNLNAALGTGPAAPLVAAMTGAGGLSTASNNVLTAANVLSGVTPGTPGPLDLINHSNLLDQFGGQVPPVVSFSNASAPVSNGLRLNQINQSVLNATYAVIHNTSDVPTATALITGFIAELNGWIAASTTAFATMQNSLVQLASLNAIGATIIHGSPDLQATMASMIAPNILPILTGSAQGLLPPDDTALNITTNYQWFQGQAFLDAVQEG
jgi:hypothetical protein